MEQHQQSSSSPAVNSRRREDQPEFNLREWGFKARISRENTNSRRYSASFIRSFREDTTRSSFRSNITISSTASSPGYSSRDEIIDPSTYSFTTALQALQARSAAYNCWECLSPEGFALNSKWNEAEKYICNPLSGEFPMECLSAKTLSGRSFRSNTSNYNKNNTNNNNNYGRMITMSAPLIFSSSRRPLVNVAQEETRQKFPLQEMKIMEGERKPRRDVGTQSTPPPEVKSWSSHSNSSSLSPAASTPSIAERSSLKRGGKHDYSPTSNANQISLQQQVKVKDMTEDDDEEEEEEVEEKSKENEKNDENKKVIKQRGCLSWMSKKQRRKEINHKPRKTFFLLPNLKGC